MLDDETGNEPWWSDDDQAVTCPDCRRAAGLALRTLTDGTQIYPGHTEKRPDGQQRDYVVLSESERAKGFVRPYRDAYKHLKCGAVTTMGRALSETYARDPGFYSGTFCCACGAHFPVGQEGEFTWIADGQRVGT
jgi:hypothetical protein